MADIAGMNATESSNGTAAADTVRGPGGDRIRDLGRADTISGGNGAERLLGGADTESGLHQSRLRGDRTGGRISVLPVIPGYLGAAFSMFILLQPIPAAHAQSNEGGCRLERETGSNRRILRCDRGLTIIAEQGARFDLVDRSGDGKADAVNLRRKAILVDAPRAAVARGFQVITPQAIAAVRGTRWAVDAGRSRTSVLVLEGRVGVRRPSARAGVTLGPGQGVDVDPGAGPLTVRRWPAARVAALLARLGQ